MERYGMKTLILLMLGVVLLVGCSSDDSDNAVISSEPDLSPDVHQVPSEYPTLATAIGAADDGDTVLVAPGSYTGAGNRDIYLSQVSLVIRSEQGPGETILDLRGDALTPHFGFNVSGQSDNLVIDGFTFRGGYAPHGAAIMVRSSSPTIRNCVFVGNEASTSGGAVRCKGSSPRIENCTFVGNSATVGGALQVLANSSPVLDRCILAMSGEGGAVYSNDGTSVPQLSCCVIYGNTGGNWDGRIADQASQNGNQEIDPLFCEPLGDFHLRPGSPCLPANNNCGVRVGALGEGCP
ncbi:hypothetical protein GF377_10235 [candidate division GN15 bacterium]|nr:hypothetical protein [candidate division GN15 bacterium]